MTETKKLLRPIKRTEKMKSKIKANRKKEG